MISASSAELPAWKKIARNAGSLIVSGGIGELLATYAVGLSALALGPAGFGTLAEAQAFMDPFETLAGFGLIQVSITIAAQGGSCGGDVRATVMGLRSGFAVVAIVTSLLLAAATGRTALLPLLLLLSASLLSSSVITSASALPFQCDQAMHRLLAVPFVTGVIRVGSAYLAYWLLCNPVGFQLSATVAAIAAALLTFLFARRYYPTHLRFDRALARRLLTLAWPIATLEVIVMIYSRGSYFLLHGAGPVVQGEFAAADKLTKPVIALAGAIVVSSLPTVARMAARQEFVELLRAYKRSCWRICLSLAPITVAACLAMPYLLRRFAPEYANASPSFRILTVGAVFMFLNQLSSAFIISLGKFRLIMAVGFANMVIYFALATQLIPLYAASGAAVATAVTEAINTIMQSFAVALLLKRAIREAATAARAPA